MKKIYSVLAAAFIGAAGLTAQADEITFTLKVDNPGSVKWAIEEDEGILTEEETTFTYDNPYGDRMYVNLYPTGDYNLVKVTNSAGQNEGYIESAFGSFTAVDGETYTITTVDVSSSRTASFTLLCDDPSAVLASYSNGISVMVESESQVIKFNPESEHVFYLNPVNYNRPFYSVTLNDAVVEGEWGRYELNLTDGCVVDVKANYPEMPYNVTINYGEGTEGFFYAAFINEKPFAEFDGGSFTANYGDYIELKSNDKWILDELIVNGEKKNYYYGTCSFLLTGDTEVSVTAHKAGDIHFTINVNNPEFVSVFQRDDDWNPVPFALVAGDNEIAVPETKNEISFEANAGCYIVSATDQNGEEYKYGRIEVKEGYTYTIVADQIVIDSTAAVYVDEIQDDWYFSANYDLNVKRTPIDLVGGEYTVVDFGAGLNPFGFSWWGAPCGQVYVNEELVEPMYEGSSTYNMSLENNDVVKLFLAAAPTVCDVTFVASEGVEATVVRDVIQEVADFREGFTAFGGTQINISGEDLKTVTANGEEVAAADGVYTITVSEDTEIAIEGALDGVAAIEASANAPVYNLQGVKVGTRASVKSLPAGIYVVEGRKVTVK